MFGPNWRVLGGFTIDGTVAGAPLLQNDGVVDTTVDNGVGDWTVNLNPDRAIDATECIALITTRESAASMVTLVHTSDTAKQLLAFDNLGGAQDAILDVLLLARQNLV